MDEMGRILLVPALMLSSIGCAYLEGRHRGFDWRWSWLMRVRDTLIAYPEIRWVLQLLVLIVVLLLTWLHGFWLGGLVLAMVLYVATSVTSGRVKHCQIEYWRREQQGRRCGRPPNEVKFR